MLFNQFDIIEKRYKIWQSDSINQLKLENI